jgi:hypothetical protein
MKRSGALFVPPANSVAANFLSLAFLALFALGVAKAIANVLTLWRSSQLDVFVGHKIAFY